MNIKFINENYILSGEYYKRTKHKTKKSRKRKINKLKIQKRIIKINIIITISFFLYLILIKEKEKKINIEVIKEKREPNINKQTNLYSIETRQPIINKQINYNSIDKDLDEEYKDMQEYIYMVMNGTLYNPNEVFQKSENPKISIVISVYNGEPYLKTALLSIENQDFKDIEIIMVDDCSKDNSINLIKELMMKDPRIRFYQNEENKGILYTKTRGVLYAKGKYVMTLDEDDIYVQRDAFSTLYSEAEENNLDLLGFSSYGTSIHLKKGSYLHRYIKTGIIYQPNIPNRMYECYSHNCRRVGDVIFNYFIRTDLFIDIIKQIDDKYMNVKMLFHDDFLMFFLLTRKAHSLKQIKRVFYIVIHWPSENNTKIQFRINEKLKNVENMRCLSFINYIEFILNKTNNDINDKRIASFELKEWFLKHECRYNKYIRERALNVLELFLKNDFIEKEVKNEIHIFLNETSQNTIINSTNTMNF